MSSRFVTSAFLVGVLAATPALAQERHARARSEQGGDRGGARGGDRGGNRGGGRQVETRTYQRTETRTYRAPQRAPQARAYDRGRDVQPRSYQAPRAYDSRRDAPRRYDVPRSYDARRYNAPRRYDAPRANDYNRRVYSRPGYVAPRRDPYYRSARPVYRGYSRPYYYRGYRGIYGYGGSYLRSRIVTVAPWRPYRYRPRFSLGVYYGAGGVYAYGYTPSYFYDPIPGRSYGGVRITEAPRDAQVFADGYYVGIVDDFDGVFQHVNLEAGRHRIEVRAPGLEPISFDVYVQPGRTITLRADDYDDGYYDDGEYGSGY